MFSARTDILARYVTFFKGLRASPSPEIRTLAYLMGRDILSTTGKNLKMIREVSGLDPWQASPASMKEALYTSGQVESSLSTLLVETTAGSLNNGFRLHSYSDSKPN